MMILSIIWLQLLANVYAGVYLLKFDMPDFLMDDSSRSRANDMLQTPIKYQITASDYLNKWPALRNLLLSADTYDDISNNDHTNDVRDLYSKFVESLRTLTYTPLRTTRALRQSKVDLADIVMQSAVKRKTKKNDTRK
uniref:Uncharacterized protein n=1 Tax=Glossina brevipalpis TaxID=37001 RepID=A0A1A9W552_9MUSC